MADLAARVGSDEKRLSRTIVRINTIESTSPLATGEHVDESSLPPALVPSEPDAPDARLREARDARARAHRHRRAAWRERKVIGLYYYGEVTMKQIGAEIGVNESRVSQLHARAIRRLREALGEMGPEQVAEMRKALVDVRGQEAGRWPRRRCPIRARRRWPTRRRSCCRTRAGSRQARRLPRATFKVGRLKAGRRGRRRSRRDAVATDSRSENGALD